LAAPAPAGTSPPPRSAASAGQSEVALRVPIDNFEYEQGFCWLYRLRHTAQGELFARLADGDQAKKRSRSSSTRTTGPSARPMRAMPSLFGPGRW